MSYSLGKLLRVNLSKSGVGVSAGVPGKADFPAFFAFRANLP